MRRRQEIGVQASLFGYRDARELLDCCGNCPDAVLEQYDVWRPVLQSRGWFYGQAFRDTVNQYLRRVDANVQCLEVA